MPTRRQVIDATPTCPGKRLSAGWKHCGRMLVWSHDHGTWACPNPKHGWVDDPEKAFVFGGVEPEEARRGS